MKRAAVLSGDRLLTAKKKGTKLLIASYETVHDIKLMFFMSFALSYERIPSLPRVCCLNCCLMFRAP